MWGLAVGGLSLVAFVLLVDVFRVPQRPFDTSRTVVSAWSQGSSTGGGPGRSYYGGYSNGYSGGGYGYGQSTFIGRLRYRFATAWSPPLEWVDAAAGRHPGLSLKLDYEEERGQPEDVHQAGAVNCWLTSSGSCSRSSKTDVNGRIKEPSG